MQSCLHAGCGILFEILPMCSMPEAQYSLTDPNTLAQYLEHANIRLVRAECPLAMY